MSESPNEKNPVNSQEVVNIFYGKTWIWKKGGAYWGEGGAFEAIYNEAVGVGKWYVTTSGTLCYEATWKKEAEEAGKFVKRCWEHVRDKDGVMWRNSVEKNFRFYKAASENAEFLSGNHIRSEVLKIRAKAGL